MASPNRQWNRCSIQTRFTYRFLHALRRLRLATRRQAPSALSSPAAPEKEITYYRRCRSVKRAAYASMASAVGTRRAWSRAQLLRLRRPAAAAAQVQRGGGAVRRRVVVVADDGGGNPSDETTTEELRQLVPGGEVMDLCSLLDETAHYINCLASQVQIMRSIADLFST